jgi:predicted amidohydrolase YtcJ
MGRVARLVILVAACAHTHDARRGDGTPNRLLILHANVRTLDPARPHADAIAISAGRIVAVGDESSARSALSGDAMVLDLAGATVLPGLVDSHGHLLPLGESMVSLNLVGTRSYEDIVERARAYASTLRPGAWLIGRGWNQNDWAEGRREFPIHALLTAALPDRPVMLERIDGHAILVNGRALALAEIGSATKDPIGGRIVRDAHGEPTGVLIDEAMGLVTKLLPAPTVSEREALLLSATRRCAELGLTGVHDMGIDVETWNALENLARSHQLPIRVYALALGSDGRVESLLRAGPQIDLFDGRLTLRGVKYFLDGALGSRGAALFEPYSDDPGNRGLDLGTEEQFEKRVEHLLRRGFQVAVHAIGDRANAHALDAYAQAIAATGVRDSRPRIEHAQVIRPQDIVRFAQGGVIASMQPTHATSDMPWAEKRLGRDRLAGAYAWRSIASAGGRLAFGSDFPVEDPNPFLGLFAAVTRTDRNGAPPGGWLPAERLTLEEALRAYTDGAAYASFEERIGGRIAPGMRADFTVVDRDPFEVPPPDLPSVRNVTTIVGGEVVYGPK